MNYDVYNPTLAARVIYDGITNAKPIRIPAGETVRNVALADHVVAELRRSAALGTNVELDVTEAEPEEAEVVEAAAPPYLPGQYSQVNPQDVPSRPPSASPERPEAPEAASPPPDRRNAPRPPLADARGRKKRA